MAGNRRSARPTVLPLPKSAMSHELTRATVSEIYVTTARWAVCAKLSLSTAIQRYGDGQDIAIPPIAVVL